MSTKATVAFASHDGEVMAAVYVHNGGDVGPELFAEFFAAVIADNGAWVRGYRFFDPSYLAAKFIVWLSGPTMASQGIGVITDPGKWHAHRRFTVRCHAEASAEPPEVTEGPDVTSPPAVITADPLLLAGLVLNWRADTEGPVLLSASREGVKVCGDVALAVIEPWLPAARGVHEALKAGRHGDAEALATHEYDRPHRDIVPIKRTP